MQADGLLWHLRRERHHLVEKRTVPAVAGDMEEPERPETPRAPPLDGSVPQHGGHRRDADASGEQHGGAHLGGVEGERATGRERLDQVALAHAVVQEAGGKTRRRIRPGHRFALDADAQHAVRRRAGHAVGANDRLGTIRNLEPDGQGLPRLPCGPYRNLHAKSADLKSVWIQGGKFCALL